MSCPHRRRWHIRQNCHPIRRTWQMRDGRARKKLLHISLSHIRAYTSNGIAYSRLLTLLCAYYIRNVCSVCLSEHIMHMKVLIYIYVKRMGINADLFRVVCSTHDQRRCRRQSDDDKCRRHGTGWRWTFIRSHVQWCSDWRFNREQFSAHGFSLCNFSESNSVPSTVRMSTPMQITPQRSQCRWRCVSSSPSLRHVGRCRCSILARLHELVRVVRRCQSTHSHTHSGRPPDHGLLRASMHV